MDFLPNKPHFEQKSISITKKPLKPAQQGDFSSQCGFYAVGNIMSLLFPKIRKTKVFEFIWDYYDETYGDAYGVLYGIHRDKLNKILCNLIDEFDLPCTVYRPWWSRKAASMDEFLNKINNSLLPPDSAIIIAYEHGLEEDRDYYSHWSIIKKITGKSLLLFDSDGESSRIPLHRCDLWPKEYSKERPYRLSSTDTFIVSKKEEKKT